MPPERNSVADVAAALAGTSDPVRMSMRLLVNRVAFLRRQRAPWVVDAPVEAVLRAGAALAALGDVSAWGAYELGEAYAQLIAPEHRAAGGVYYTPEPVADAMAYAALAPRLAARSRVRVFDPACGAGVMLESAACMLAERDYGIDPALMGAALYGTDIDPVAVEIAKSALWLRSDGTAPITFLDGNLVCADPLTGTAPPKLGVAPGCLVVLGNPPYKDKAGGCAPWIEAPREDRERVGERPVMRDFHEPGLGRLAHVLSSMSTFFWRFALWKAFEAREGPGVVAFVCPSAFISGEAYGQMRAHMRRLADEGWVIDITPEGHQPPQRTRVFPGVQIPLCIAVFARHGATVPEVPAAVSYAAAEGEREVKIRRIAGACKRISLAPAPAPVERPAVLAEMEGVGRLAQEPLFGAVT